MKNVTEKKIGKKKRKLKSLVIFHSANKINNYNGRQRGGKNEREKIIQKNLQVKTRIVGKTNKGINVERIIIG